MIESHMILDSISGGVPRLVTMRTIAPKFIHQETLRHRLIYIEDALRGDFDWSLSVSSSRAIPFPKLLAEVRSDELRAEPVKWGSAQAGMSPGEELSDELGDDPCVGAAGELLSPRAMARLQWKRAALAAGNYAEYLNYLGVHKSIVNRIIEPYIHAHVLMTATAPGWMNFFGLRLDRAADPTLQALAEACWREWNESTPRKLESGQWHLPFIDDEYREEVAAYLYGVDPAGWEKDAIGLLRSGLIQVSTACCAHLSYESFETGKRMPVERCIELHDRFVKSVPMHASPMEHQARPDELTLSVDRTRAEWREPQLAGNLGPGWVQYRKTIPGEALAPLPEGYQYQP